MARLWALALFLVPTLAQGALSPLKDHPLKRQAEAYLLAAAKALEAQSAPVALSLQGNYARLGYECTPQALCASLPEDAKALTLALVLTPFPFGEAADGLARAEIGLRRAELAYRKTLTALQAQAVAAYGRYQEALLGVRLAEKGVALAQLALEATRKRQGSPKDLREAELALKEAQNRLAEAELGLKLAEEAAAGLVDLKAPLPEIPLPQGTTPLGLEEARLALAEAQIGERAAWRNLLPTLQGSLSLYPSGNDTLSLSLSSKDLRPTLAYTRQDPARPPTTLPGAGQYRTTEELRLSLSLTLSPGLLAGYEAAKAQVRGAEEALRAAEIQTHLEKARLENALKSAEASLALARLRREAAQKALEEVQARLALGLESPLGVLQAELNLLQAELNLLQAENNLRNRRMELYQFYGEILPEVAR
ncbi:TolC family protein [Thermus brockianus]|uniref:Outer membrane efflux protein n=1 Tax=Thermus brockianus TaxID=56956 RepID=A0A1J0LQH0_THEBO|nr:TolC family protein [Thermus brockianus]APD08520.1 Outer membrane efflux protein [Thermus brockianus]BDG16127.1 transporter [Thermus brockianus]